jgi:hypothetical protein
VAIDKVRPLKLEDPASGGDETDDFPTSLDPSEDNVQCNGIVLEDASHSDENVRVWRDGDDLKFKDTNNPADHTLTQLLSGGGISEAQHEALATLVHEIDATSYEEYTYSGADITNCTIWTSIAKTKKIREEQYVYGSGHRVDQVTTIQYDSTGAEKMRTVEAYTYLSSNRVNYVQRTKTGSP